MKNILLIILLYTTLNPVIFAQQKNDYLWILGYTPNDSVARYGGTMLDFNYNPPLLSYFDIPVDIISSNALISNGDGNLVAYTNGCSIINREHQIMENGDSINAGIIHDLYCEHDYPVEQGVLMLPYPGDTRQTIVLQIWYNYEPLLPIRFLYSVVVQNDSFPNGLITEKNIEIIQDSLSLQLSAVRHANGRDWWIVLPEYNSNTYNFFLFDPWGIHIYNKQNIGTPWSTTDWGGQACFSPDGSKYIRANHENGCQVYDFDRCDGILSNPVHIEFPTDTTYSTGVAVSASSRYLYVMLTTKIYQFDLHADNIEASKILVATYDGFSTGGFATTFYQGMLAPNGKIYITSTNGVYTLHVIEEPDQPGLNCQVNQHGLETFTYHGFTVPNFPHFRTGPIDGSICDSLGIDGPPVAVDEVAVPTAVLKVWPNPASGMLSVQIPGSNTGELLWSDITGRIIRRQPVPMDTAQLDLDISDLAPGLYILIWISASGEQISAKIVVQR